MVKTFRVTSFSFINQILKEIDDIKVKVKDPWGFRLDVRQYNMGKPFNLPNASGRLLMWEFSGSISFFL